jgi:hypothetical protein
LNRPALATLLAVLFPLAHAASRPETEARAILRRVLTVEGRKGFQTAACRRIPPAAWAKLALLGQPIRHTLKFAPGCDAEGTITLTRGLSPVDLTLRHLRDVSRVRANLATGLQADWMNQLGTIHVHAGSGVATLRQGGPMGFEGDYEVVIGPEGSVRENRGGELRVSRLGASPVDVREKLQFGGP